VVAVDGRQRVVRVNAMARRLLRLRDAVPFPADHLPRERMLREALAEALAGRATEEAVELRHDDRVLMLTARPLAGGGAVLAFYDLTPLRRLETVRRDFVANVSHELRTPLTVIGGFAETLADDDLPPAQRRQFAATIEANALRMQRIVDDLLDLSRIESGGWRPVPSRVDVAQAAEEAAAAARDAAATKGVALRVTPAADARLIFADPTAVRQVLSNLTENAVRHTAAGEVTVFTRRAPQGGVWLGVRDTGSGIGPEHLPRIFERFYRADPGRSREAGGTGLGLAIVKHLAEAHGGEVRAESRLGVGTTIEVRFPEAGPLGAVGAPTPRAAAAAT
jgi:signal transduction histidine kinase